jgi:hypothetical protein
MKHLYGEFSENQIAQTKKSLRGSIFFLLLCVDPKTSWEYEDVDVNQCFNGLLLKIGGLNELLLKQPEIVTTMSLLQAALMEFNNPEFNFKTYRKLILDAGAEIEKLREED